MAQVRAASPYLEMFLLALFRAFVLMRRAPISVPSAEMPLKYVAAFCASEQNFKTVMVISQLPFLKRLNICRFVNGTFHQRHGKNTRQL